MNFSERLKKLRDINNLTQEDIANILNVTRPTVAGYETKGKQPDYEKLKKLADYFNVTIDWLLGRTDVKSNIDKNSNIDTIAAHLEGKNITPQKLKLLEKYIDALFEEDEE